MLERYLTYIRNIRRYSPRTCEAYRTVLEDYRDFAGPFPASLTIPALRSYEVELLDTRKMHPRTVCLHISVLSGFCRFLMKEGVLTGNPARLLQRPKVDKRLPEFYRAESLAEYFRKTEADVADGSYERRLARLVISLLANTGIRRAELIALRISSVDFSRGVLHVRGKGDKMREIPLIPSLCSEISLYLNAASSLMDTSDLSAALLRTPKGAPLYPVWVDRTVKRELGSVKEVTVRKSPHVLRHTLATELLGDGADMNAIKELLGHASLAATQIYTHNSIGRLQKVYNQAHPRAKNGGKNGD